MSCEVEIDSATQFVGEEIADYAAAIALAARHRYLRSADFVPLNFQRRALGKFGCQGPVHRYAPLRLRQGAILCGVGRQFMHDHRHSVSCVRCEVDSGTMEVGLVAVA